MAAVAEGESWGFNRPIRFQYGYADRLLEGTAKVMKSGKWVYIDPGGKIAAAIYSCLK